LHPPRINRPHGGVRGNNLSRSSVLFGGPFGRIFRAVPAADFGPDDQKSIHNLDALAAAMISPPDDPKDGPDNEESGIPAAYTYLGQFIDHDLTFDPASSLQKQNDPDALVDFRTPQFDLDNLYGRGPSDQPYMYNNDGRTFVLGQDLTGAPNPAKDLQRNGQYPARALIGDPRNDENVIVSQLQGLWHRFHNRIAADNPSWDFPRVQQEVRFHYQWVVIHDFLPAIVNADVLAGVLPPGKKGKRILAKANLQFYHYRDTAYIPLEFSAAAYRFGHSMVRPGYRLNDTVPPLPIFSPDPKSLDLSGFQAPKPNWALDWKRFIDLEPLDYGTLVEKPDQKDPKNQKRLQLAYKIDTALVGQLGALPISVAGAGSPRSLAQRNLERGWRMRLPNGQDLAKAMGLTPLPDDQILIGKFTGDKNDSSPIVKVAGTSFAGNCPLWTYVLAETLETKLTVKTLEGNKPITTRQLGPVGGRIVAETFLGLLLADSTSYANLNPLWEPSLQVDGVFGLRELIRHALGG
jgi:hypothetical protein